MSDVKFWIVAKDTTTLDVVPTVNDHTPPANTIEGPYDLKSDALFEMGVIQGYMEVAQQVRAHRNRFTVLVDPDLEPVMPQKMLDRGLALPNHLTPFAKKVLAVAGGDLLKDAVKLIETGDTLVTAVADTLKYGFGNPELDRDTCEEIATAAVTTAVETILKVYWYG